MLAGVSANIIIIIIDVEHMLGIVRCDVLGEWWGEGVWEWVMECWYCSLGVVFGSHCYAKIILIISQAICVWLSYGDVSVFGWLVGFWGVGLPPHKTVDDDLISFLFFFAFVVFLLC